MKMKVWYLKALKDHNMGLYVDSADYILFQSFEIRGYILNNQKISTGLDSCFRSLFLIL